MAANHLLEVCGLSKRFPGVQALCDVDLHVDAGEVLAVVGANGAGKSTLMKILAGIERPDAGQILLDGQIIEVRDVPGALAHGIVLIHQELNLAGTLSVVANLFLGREQVRAGIFLDRRSAARDGQRLLSRVGLKVPLNRSVCDLPLGQQQLIEIARALHCNARIIIMDEPTSSLTQAETDRLFVVIDELKRAGVAILYISHRLAEVNAVADRVTVLRDGRNAGDLIERDISHDAIVKLMIGRDWQPSLAKMAKTTSAGPVRLDLRGVRYSQGPAHAVSMIVRGGEIVGLAGLVGAGRTELAEAIFGLRHMTTGEVRIDDKPVSIRHPREAIRLGLLLVPEDRRHAGLILGDAIQRNLSLPNLEELSSLQIISRRGEATLAERMIDKLHIRTTNRRKTVGLLSGGNQQKVVFGKWLARGPKVLILDEPTRGVDVAARGEIYTLMNELMAAGVAILMISSDMEELLAVSDRILVMHEGVLAGELAKDQINEEAIMQLATGG